MRVPEIGPGPLTRRRILRTVPLMLGSVFVHDFGRLRAAAGRAESGVSDTAVILIWLPGGPPHLDMYDMKPQRAGEYRGEFRPIPTVVPGLDVCELMPLHAQTAQSSASSARSPTSLPITVEGTSAFSQADCRKSRPDS